MGYMKGSRSTGKVLRVVAGICSMVMTRAQHSGAG